MLGKKVSKKKKLKTISDQEEAVKRCCRLKTTTYRRINGNITDLRYRYYQGKRKLENILILKYFID